MDRPLLSLGLAFVVSTLAACAGTSASPSETTDPTGASEQELSSSLDCSQQQAIESAWELLIVESEATAIAKSELPPAAARRFARVKHLRPEALKAVVEGKTMFAVTNDPADPGPDEVQGEVAVYFAEGPRVAFGYWHDSPQLFWRGRCD